LLWKNWLKTGFSIKSKVDFPKAEVLENPQVAAKPSKNISAPRQYANN